MMLATSLASIFQLATLGYIVQGLDSGAPEEISTFSLVAAEPATVLSSTIDGRRLWSWLPSALQSGREDFLRLIALNRAPQCAVEADPNRRSALTWTVGEYDPEVQYAYQSENAARRLSDHFLNEDIAALIDQSHSALPSSNGEPVAVAATPTQCLLEKKPKCNSAWPFRTLDGSCNNLQRPLWASANYPQARMGKAAYQDGISAPRHLSVTSKPSRPVTLPSARQVSTALSRNKDAQSPDTTFMLVQFAQFIAHDISNTLVEKVPDPNNSSNSVTVQCCLPNANTSPNCPLHPSCFPISIPANDRVFGRLNITCMEFTRSKPAPVTGCALKARVPVNGVAAYIDASHIYGNSDKDAKRLRSGWRGMMRINESPLMKKQDVVMVPGGANALSCVAPSADKPCVDAGDVRINLHTGLVALHSLFLREHNRIAKFLVDRSPAGPTDEMAFQVTRKIVSAMLQHMAFKELLPLILGKKIYNDPRNGLALKENGFANSYGSDVDATVMVEFAAAAFRLHTLSGNELPLLMDNGTETPFFLHFFNPNMWYKEGVLDKLIAGMARKRAQQFDADFSFVFQNQMYKAMDKPMGFDQLAVNIQRGRDHGLPTYPQMRKLCGLPPINDVSDLQRATSAQNAASLTSVYSHISDTDFYAGGISEKPVNNEGLCGPTFACVLTEQFRRLKMGDRFFYENDNVLTPEQLTEIRRVSLASIMCLNSPIDKLQARVLEAESPTNPVMSCKDILARSSVRLEPFLQKMM